MAEQQTQAKPKKATKPKAPASHPPPQQMVTAAITALKERKGSSLQAIKKYVKANYKVGDNYDIHIRRCVKNMVANGKLSQTKGKGASGSFKLDNKAAKAEAAIKKKTDAAKAKKVAQKEKDKAKRAAKKAKAAAKKASKTKKPKSPKKKTPKKTKKSPAKKAAAKPAK